MKSWRSLSTVSRFGALPDLLSGRRTPRKFLERCLDAVVAARRTIFWLLAASTICFTASAQEIPLQIALGQNPPDARNINDYTGAVGAIVWVMVRQFDLPAPRGTLEVHQTRESFERAMVKHLKIAPDLAKTTAQFAKSAVGSYTVLVNAPAIADTSWAERIELLAHELTHSVQLTLADRPGIARHQWLIEGYAEWMAFSVTDTLDLDNLAGARARITEKVREQRRKGELPRLVQLDSFASWVDARRQYGFDGTYSLSFLVADFLIQRHSHSAVADYFRRYRQSDDADANFRAVFGEDLEAFWRACDGHLDRLLM